MSWSPVKTRSDKATISKMGCWVIDDLRFKSQVYPDLTLNDGTKIIKSPAWIVADLHWVERQEAVKVVAIIDDQGERNKDERFDVGRRSEVPNVTC